MEDDGWRDLDAGQLGHWLGASGPFVLELSRLFKRI
jgi:hypothetical protein